ncbi:MAG TPA: cation-translocating P-type ATPase [Ktedonobacterales bacterium]|jgi:Cd2+/Zn2+-exporting ATPase/Cu+-exporting ATPase
MAHRTDALQQVEVPIRGMDCLECTHHVQHALAALPGMAAVQVYLTSEKAVLQMEPALIDLSGIRQAVEGAGYSVPLTPATPEVSSSAHTLASFTRPVLTLFGLVVGAVLLVVVAGEWLGIFERVTERVPWWLGTLLVVLIGAPIYTNVLRAALRRQIISHTLMSLGVVSALVVGQWTTAAVVVFFMYVGSYAEHFTTERSRQAVKRLTALAPQTARVEREEQEQEVAVGEVQIGETVIIHPGERIPVDGIVLEGQATVDQATITGESLPVEVHADSHVFATTIASLGHLKVRTTQVGADTTYGRVVQLVEEAEAHRAEVQRLADRFSTYFLPVVASIALLTFLVSRNPLATAAVLVVACSCSLALATPIAMLASIGAGAKRGLLIKGGKYLEALAQANVLFVDKTGTLTTGRPQIVDIVALAHLSEAVVLQLAASAERYSEHPLAEAVCRTAAEQHLPLEEPARFEAVPGAGVRALVGGKQVAVGNARLLSEAHQVGTAQDLEAQGKTLLFVAVDDEVVGVLAATDTVRPEVTQALAEVRTLGITHIELLTGDHEQAAARLAKELGIAYQANLLPEDKIALVKTAQAKGQVVVMVGDGVNDAPALAQANVGIAMGAAGSEVALEAAHLALMRDDWSLVPEALRIARRTMRTVKLNIGFTALYNLVGLSLAALGLLPPNLAAAAQSLPDLGILANSSRLLRAPSAPRTRR